MKKYYSISLDVAENDPVDIRCGGPHFLGFDFYVYLEENDKDELIEKLRVACRNRKFPMFNISMTEKETKGKNKIWNTDQMLQEIKDYVI